MKIWLNKRSVSWDVINEFYLWPSVSVNMFSPLPIRDIWFELSWLSFTLHIEFKIKRDGS